MPHVGGLILRRPKRIWSNEDVLQWVLGMPGFSCCISKVNINVFQVAMQTTAKVSRLVGTRPIELGTSWAIYFQGGTVISLLRSMDSSSNKLNVCGINSLVGMGCPATTTTTTTTTTSPPDGTQVHAANVANEWQVQGGLGKLVMPAGTCKINPFEK